MATQTYEVDLVVHDPGGEQSRVFYERAADVQAAVHLVEQAERAYFSVELDGGGLSLSVFHAWLAGAHAWLRVDEHREWFAALPGQQASESRDGVTFSDGDGSTFTVPAAETIPRAQVFVAFAHWLATGERTPELAWS